MDTAVYPQQQEEGYSAKLVRCRADLSLPSSLGYWMLRFLRSLSCHTCLQSKAVFRKKAASTTGSGSKNKRTFSHFVHKIPLHQGILSSLNDNNKCDALKCCASFGLVARTSGLCVHSLGVQRAAMDNLFSEDRSARQSIDCGSSTLSADVYGDGTSSEALSFGIGEVHDDHAHGDDIASSSEGSSPLGWPLRRTETSCSGIYDNPLAVAGGRDSVMCPETRKKRETDLSEVEMMKERFSKLLLGEDMSGSGKGVCTALAISNAITNLSATIFGQLWRLEPLALEKKTMWHREMEWLLCVSDYIVELIPARQNFANGSCIEVMVTRPRSDMCLNLPALRKLDAMLLETLDSFSDTEFWYVDQGLLVQDADVSGPLRRPPQRQEDKWWLPIPRVPACGLCDNARKQLQHQRECTSQILKASMAINSSILSEMEVPEIYLEALPKNGKASLGDIIYRYISADQFSPDCLLDCLDLSSEHHTLNIANRVEAAIQIWRQKLHAKHSHNAKENRPNSRSSWGMVKDFMGDLEKREMLADRAESLLLSLKQRFPGLSQTVLDTSKIQYNKDVGQSILESYSRVLESLAFNIIARIDDLLYVDDLTRNSDLLQYPSIPPSISNRSVAAHKRVSTPFSGPLSSNTPYATAFATPNFSPTPLLSPGRTASSPFVSGKVIAHNFTPPTKVLSDCLAGDTRTTDGKTKDPARLGSPVAKEMGKNWSYAENVESRKGLTSPLTRD